MAGLPNSLGGQPMSQQQQQPGQQQTGQQAFNIQPPKTRKSVSIVNSVMLLS